MKREDVDPFLKSLAGPKYRPYLLAAAIAAPAVTLLATMCLCCGASSWLFPPSRRQVDEAPVAKVAAEPEFKITQEEVDRMMRRIERKHAEDRLRSALKKNPELPALRPGDFEYDQVGTLPAVLTVVQIIDGENAIVTAGRGSVFWLTDVPTRDWVDDKMVRLDGVFVVTENRKYLTVTGAGKTVSQLRWLSPEVVNEVRATP